MLLEIRSPFSFKKNTGLMNYLQPITEPTIAVCKPFADIVSRLLFIVSQTLNYICKYCESKKRVFASRAKG